MRFLGYLLLALSLTCFLAALAGAGAGQFATDFVEVAAPRRALPSATAARARCLPDAGVAQAAADPLVCG